MTVQITEREAEYLKKELERIGVTNEQRNQIFHSFDHVFDIVVVPKMSEWNVTIRYDGKKIHEAVEKADNEDRASYEALDKINITVELKTKNEE